MVNVSDSLYVNDSGFVFDYYTGLTYNLNHTGIFIIKQLLEGTPRAAIARTLETKYGISHEAAASDLDDFLQQLDSLKLLEPSEAPPDD